jgi:hypothetical protein
VEVERVVKGFVRDRTIEVFQGGGPQQDGALAVLAQFMDDPLLLPGDDLILLLIPARSPE